MRANVELTVGEVFDYMSMLEYFIEIENKLKESKYKSVYQGKIKHINTYIKIYNYLFGKEV